MATIGTLIERLFQNTYARTYSPLSLGAARRRLPLARSLPLPPPPRWLAPSHSAAGEPAFFLLVPLGGYPRRYRASRSLPSMIFHSSKRARSLSLARSIATPQGGGWRARPLSLVFTESRLCSGSALRLSELFFSSVAFFFFCFGISDSRAASPTSQIPGRYLYARGRRVRRENGPPEPRVNTGAVL